MALLFISRYVSVCCMVLNDQPFINSNSVFIFECMLYGALGMFKSSLIFTKFSRKKKEEVSLLVSWVFWPSQPQRITSGLGGIGGERGGEREKKKRNKEKERERTRESRGSSLNAPPHKLNDVSAHTAQVSLSNYRL